MERNQILGILLRDSKEKVIPPPRLVGIAHRTLRRVRASANLSSDANTIGNAPDLSHSLCWS